MEAHGWFGWWGDADWVVRSVFICLVVMSVAGWTVILHKAVQFSRLARRERRLAVGLDRPEARLVLDAHDGPSGLFRPVLDLGLHGEALQGRLAQAVREARVELEGGLVVLATIGNTAPFIGLLGTVWGIMHALQGLGGETALTLAMVGGPVAEALVATAAGLFAAIPAVVGYNMLLRQLSRLMVVIEGNCRRVADAFGHEQPRAATVAMLRPGEVR